MHAPGEGANSRSSNPNDTATHAGPAAPDPEQPEQRSRSRSPIRTWHGELPRIPTWEKNSTQLTNAEKTSMIEAYLQEREEHPHGVTASGLGVYIKTHGVLLQRGFLRSGFCMGTRWTVSPDGRFIIPR